MTHPIPDQPPLLPCPFYGRPASVSGYRAAKGQPETYSVGCFKSTDDRAPAAFWDDCLKPMSDWLPDIGRAVELWNTRGKPAGRG